MSDHIFAAYGVGLNRTEMAKYCPTAKSIGVTELKNFRLAFRGGNACAVASIEKAKGGSVPALLWEIATQDEAALDRLIGSPEQYRKETVKVKLGRASVPAMAYIMNEGRPLALPGAYYYATIRQGYKDCGLDDAVLKAAAAFSAKEEEDER